MLIARTGHRTNEIVKVLTLASVIFLPGALIAGIMGMNFKPGLFNHPALFWATIAMIISIAVVTIVDCQNTQLDLAQARLGLRLGLDVAGRE